MRILQHTLSLSLAALFVAPVAWAQTAPETATPNVTITAKRGAAGDSKVITAAKSKVLSRNLASGCNYMSAYSAAEDDVTQAYMTHFGMEDSASNDAERIYENSPNGDASNETLPAAQSNDVLPGATASAGCTNGDRNFAAGRNRIARKDTSLGAAFAAYDAKDYATAMAQGKIAYNKVGYDEAALLVARLYLYGLGTPQDTKQAIYWLKRVTEARFDPMRDTVKFDPKDPEAMTPRVEATLTLAKVYLRGMGTPKDPAEANKWFAKAAEIGFMPANNTLGMADLSGYGGPRDVRRAVGHFKEAAEAGYAPAQFNLAKLYYNADVGVPQDYKQAGAWFSAAAKAGHPGALFAAGRMIDLGQGMAPDPKRAIVYYKEAALKNNADAQTALASFFYTGEVVDKNLETARKLFLAAAHQGQADAMFNLGVMAMHGEAGPKDMATAYVWFTLAQQAGYDGAGAALAQVAPALSKADHAKVDAVLKPKSKS